MIENLYEDLSVHLYEGEPITKKAPTPPPTYLTQWKIVGNSEVYTLPYPDGVVLPNGYKRCKYLTFDGNSYINTGVKTANDIGYDLRCKVVSLKTLIGARRDLSFSGFVTGFFQTTKVAAAYGRSTSTEITVTHDYTDDSVHHIILDSVKFQIDDEILDISSLRSTADSFYDIYLGTWNNSEIPDYRMWASDIYDTIIYNTQGELWHGIPCLDANDVPCFYDIISQTAFYNQGSGSFTYKLYPQPTEIWSCGEYNATDGKYHILVQPQGGSIADIALTEPLRKVNDVADTIEFADGVATVTRKIAKLINLQNKGWQYSTGTYRYFLGGCGAEPTPSTSTIANILSTKYTTGTPNNTLASSQLDKIISIQESSSANILIKDTDFVFEGNTGNVELFKQNLVGVELIYELKTPTTELVDAPQIEEAESYTCVISQGGKAVSWSSFTINNE